MALCSTPCGITARATARAQELGERVEVLNALRHHGEGDATPAGRRSGPRCVLNALRHHGEGDRDHHLGDDVRHGECSTPCGITARATLRMGSGDGGYTVCSTPCGITARATSSPSTGGSPTRARAQRLAASRRGRRRPATALRLHRELVLNALRHHGEGDHGESPWMTAAPPGAQRLAASRRGRRMPPARLGVEAAVLNALRHHGEGDEPVVAPEGTPPERCSTPCGITARATPSAAAKGRSTIGAQRLAASRRGRPRR